jgi:hypothetical protein
MGQALHNHTSISPGELSYMIRRQVPVHAFRVQWARGPMALALRPVQNLSFFLSFSYYSILGKQSAIQVCKARCGRGCSSSRWWTLLTLLDALHGIGRAQTVHGTTKASYTFAGRPISKTQRTIDACSPGNGICKMHRGQCRHDSILLHILCTSALHEPPSART